MVNCTCYDYQHGHLCKHAHKVYSREKQEQNGTDEDNPLEIGDADTPDAIPDEEDQVTILKTHVAPSKAIQDKAGIVMNRTSCHAYSKMDFYILLLALKGKRNSIKGYLKEIEEAVEEIEDGGVLDHVLSKIFATATSVQAYCKPQTENPAQEPACFHVTDKFAPAQKNETQLRFQKMKSTRKKTTTLSLKYVCQLMLSFASQRKFFY